MENVIIQQNGCLDNQNLLTKPKRNYGVDFLRIISMCMVVILHVVNHGGTQASFAFNSAGFYATYALEAFAICAVNVFALITGYVNCENSFRFNKVIKFWAQVAFYSVLIYLAFVATKVITFDVNTFLYTFLPITNNNDWFSQTYIFLMIFMPFYNFLVAKMGKRKHLILIIVSAFLFTIVALLFQNVWQLNSGYGVVWLTCLYFIGAYFKKYGFFKIKNYWYLISYVAFSLLIVISLAGIGNLMLKIRNDTSFSEIFYSYLSPLVLAQSVCLLAFFANLEFKNKKFIAVTKFVTPLVFGVYLIHDNPLVRYNLITKTVFIANYSPILIILLILAVAIGIFIACAIVEYLRQLFFKYAKINWLLDKIGIGAQNKFNKLIDKYTKE